jgi:hypothetical protein
VASITTYAWEDMSNYVRKKEQSVGNFGPRNEEKM